MFCPFLNRKVRVFSVFVVLHFLRSRNTWNLKSIDLVCGSPRDIQIHSWHALSTESVQKKLLHIYIIAKYHFLALFFFSNTLNLLLKAICIKNSISRHNIHYTKPHKNRDCNESILNVVSIIVLFSTKRIVSYKDNLTPKCWREITSY